MLREFIIRVSEKEELIKEHLNCAIKFSAIELVEINNEQFNIEASAS